jgi:hypothetical protein
VAYQAAANPEEAAAVEVVKIQSVSEHIIPSQEIQLPQEKSVGQRQERVDTDENESKDEKEEERECELEENLVELMDRGPCPTCK